MVLDNLDDLEEDVEDTTFDFGGRKVALEDVERAYGALAQAKDIASVVTPSKVILATGLVLLLFKLLQLCFNELFAVLIRLDTI